MPCLITSGIAGVPPTRPVVWGSLGMVVVERRGMFPALLCEVWRGVMREERWCESETNVECVGSEKWEYGESGGGEGDV